MRLLLLVWCGALIGAAAYACGGQTSFPKLDVTFAGSYINADNVEVDATNVPFDAAAAHQLDVGATSINFVARVMAPEGAWQLTVTADGALATTGGATVTRNFVSDSDRENIIYIPLGITSPVGAGTVHVSVGQSSADFVFLVNSNDGKPGISLLPCVAVRTGDATIGNCVGDPGAGDGGALDSGDAATTYPGVPDPGSLFAVGDPLLVQASFTKGAAGGAWPLVLSATGSVAFLTNGSPTGTVSLTVTDTTSELWIPAVIQAAGPAVISARFGNGATTSKTFTTVPNRIAPARVEFLGHVGLEAVNRLTVCTGLADGTVTATVGTAGSVQAPSAQISPTESGLCPPRYQGEAVFVWQGAQGQVPWTFSYGGVAVSVTQLVDMLGVDAQPSITGKSFWRDVPDAGAFVETRVSVRRRPFPTVDSGTGDAGPFTEPVVHGAFQVTPSAGATSAGGTFVTDSLGNAVFVVNTAGGVTTFDVTLSAPGFAQVFAVDRAAVGGAIAPAGP